MSEFNYGLSILFHWSVCLFLYQYHTFLITVTLWYCLKPRRVMPPAWFFLRIALAFLGLLYFHINFRIRSSRHGSVVNEFDYGSIPGLAQWVKDLALPMSCGVGCRRGSDPALLLLWRRPVATVPIIPLAWEPPTCHRSGPRNGKKTKNKIIK